MGDTLRPVAKLFAVGVTAVLALSACGGSDSSTADGSAASSSSLTVGLAYDIGGRGDKSFNDAAGAGLDKAASELGVAVDELDATSGESDDQRAQRLRTLAQKGDNPVIAVGYAYSTALATVAAEFPDTDFAIIDDAQQTSDNITNLVFAEEQGSYLVGAIAAEASKTGTIGFVGGVETALIEKFEAGYVAGATAADPDIKIEVKYLTPAGDNSGFSDPAKGKTAAEGQIDAGADVIYHAAGGSGSGVFEAVAAAGTGHWAIGVDSDQYLTSDDSVKDYILTSMLKRVDTAVFDMIKSVVDGAPLEGTQTFDLAAEGVGYSTSNSAVADYTAKADEFATKITAGDVTVPTTPES